MDEPNAGTEGPAPANPGVIAADIDPVNPLRDPRDGSCGRPASSRAIGLAVFCQSASSAPTSPSP